MEIETVGSSDPTRPGRTGRERVVAFAPETRRVRERLNNDAKVKRLDPWESDCRDSHFCILA